ncbi:MAG: acyl-CoA dehydrogenase [Rhodobacteraceae bacterium]|nr:acyl-CoA dehydrogenase [Paracoccaceae bacterium]
MHFEPTKKVTQLKEQLNSFMEKHIIPADVEFQQIAETGTYPIELINRLKVLARKEGLWNLFLPGLRNNEPGTRLSNVEYAPLAEIMGRYPWASEVFNCSAPDTGNMELLHLFATPEQEQIWLKPLLDGSIRSAVSITEPDVASSDPTNLQTTIERDGDHFVINGKKWFTTGALHPNFKFTMVLGVSDQNEDSPRHQRHSFVLVPAETEGLRIIRNLPIMNHLALEGHCELEFSDVRVPITHLVGEEGKGFALAQARLGPGRVHHCMRTIGQCERALELMCQRALDRQAFGRNLSEFSNIQDWIAESRMEIDQARLLNLYASWLMDTQGNKAARILISEIKVVATRLQTRVLDRAIQVWGAAGLTNDTPLSYLWSWGRALRFIDGPDEVHLRSIARAELKKYNTNKVQ